MPPRRSSRLTEKQASAATRESPTVDLSPVPDDPDDLDAEPRSRKKRRIAVQEPGTAGSRPRKGRLQRLLDFPIELLSEIFTQLGPLDILHLSQVSKEFRSFFLSVRQRLIWKAALANAPDMPPCPEDLNEPEYINLALKSHCHYCLAPNVQELMWVFRVRACKSCTEKRFMRCCYHISGPQLPYHADRQGQYLYSRDMIKDLDRRDEGQSAEVAAEARYLFREERMKGSAQYYEWSKRRATDHRKALEDARGHRLGQIEERLSEDGWKLELEYLEGVGNGQLLNSFRHHKLVNQPKELTDRIWANVRPTLTDLFSRFREKRLQEIAKTTLKSRRKLFQMLLSDFYDSRHMPNPVMPVYEAYMRSTAKKLIEDTPYDQSLTTEDFQGVIADLPHLAEQWREETIQKILDAVKGEVLISTNTQTDVFEAEESEAKMVTADDLILATTVFYCRPCGKFLWFKDFWKHYCFSRRSSYISRDDVVDAFGSEEWRFHAKLWDSQAVQAQRAMREILISYGLDPQTATVEELELERPLLLCNGCSSNAEERLVTFSWRGAVTHAVRTIHKPGPSTEGSPLWDCLRRSQEAVLWKDVHNQSRLSSQCM